MRCSMRMQCWRTKGKFISQFALWQLPLVLPANFVHSLFTFSASWQPSLPHSTLHLQRKLISPLSAWGGGWQTQFGKQNPRHNNNRNRIRHQQATMQGACGELAIPAEGLGTDIKRCQVLSNSIAGETSPSSSSPASLLSFALCNSN